MVETRFQVLLVFQDGGHVKFPARGQHPNVKIPTQGKAYEFNFPLVACQSPPPTLGFHIEIWCIIQIQCNESL